jgi:hypothetical protein
MAGLVIAPRHRLNPQWLLEHNFTHGNEVNADSHAELELPKSAVVGA